MEGRRVLERAAAAAKKQEKLDKKERAVTLELFHQLYILPFSSIGCLLVACDIVRCSALFPVLIVLSFIAFPRHTQRKLEEMEAKYVVEFAQREAKKKEEQEEKKRRKQEKKEKKAEKKSKKESKKRKHSGSDSASNSDSSSSDGEKRKKKKKSKKHSKKSKKDVWA